MFVPSLESPQVDEDDLGHLSRSLRLRDGDPLTISDGAGSWRRAEFVADGRLDVVGDVFFIPERPRPLTVAFSLVKGSKPELVIQKLTELGLDRIVVLAAHRSVVRWDNAKVDKAMARWQRIVREAAMQSHRVRLPELEAVVSSTEWLAAPENAISHFDGEPITNSVTSLAIGPEGGWDDVELDIVPAESGRRFLLGHTVLRAETAAITAGALLTASARSPESDVR